MKNILVVEGSVREGRVADKIIEQLNTLTDGFSDANFKVADLKEINLPFFNHPVSPLNWQELPDIPGLKKWYDLVNDSDGVILVTPEYNSSTSAVLKNAIDWLYEPWKDKPVALIGYGWDGSIAGRRHLRDIMQKLKASLVPVEAGFSFQKDIDLSGEALNDDAKNAIKKTITALLEQIK